MIRLLALTLLLLGFIFSTLSVSAQQSLSGNDQPEKEELTFAIVIARDNPFWANNVRYAKAAAEQLNINLIVKNFNDDPQLLLKQVEELGKQDIDGLVFEPYQGSAEEVLRITERYNIPALTFHTRVPNIDFRPRTKYKSWKGELYTDNVKDGESLLQQLLAKAKLKGIKEKHVLAITGLAHQEVSIETTRGLKRFLKHNPDVKSSYFATGNFNAKIAADRFEELYKKHPEVNVIWCASDNMARGVYERMQKLGIDKPVVIGGIGWDADTSELLAQEKLDIIVAGHVMQAPWALVMLFDLNRGEDFAKDGLDYELTVSNVYPENVEIYKDFFALPAEEVNFKVYSKYLNPSRKPLKLEILELVDNSLASINGIKLSMEEKQFIESLGILRVHNDASWAPLNFNVNGDARGYSIDFFKLIASRLNLRVEYVHEYSWPEMLRKLKDHEIDVITNLAWTAQRDQHYLYTDAFMDIPEVIVTRKGLPITDMASLSGKTIAIPEGYNTVKLLADNHSNIIVKTYADTEACLVALDRAEVDAVIELGMVIQYLISQKRMTNLHITGNAEIINNPDSKLYFGIRNDWPLLRSAMNKAMKSISNEKKLQLERKWMNALPAQHQQPGGPHFEESTRAQSDSGRFNLLQTIAVIVGILIVLVLGNWLLIHLFGNHLPVGLQSTRTKFIGVVVMSGFLAAVVIGCTVGLNLIRSQLIENTTDQLDATVRTTQVALYSWVNREKEHTKHMASDPMIVRSTQQLIYAESRNQIQTTQLVRQQLTDFFNSQKTTHVALHSEHGYSLMGIDGQVLASSHEEWLDQIHPVKSESEALFHSVLRGNIAFIRPIHLHLHSANGDDHHDSDQHGKHQHKHEHKHEHEHEQEAGDDHHHHEQPHSALMILAPVRNERDEIIGLLSLEYDTDKSFSDIFRAASSKGGQRVYSFYDDGHIIGSAESREDLQRLGLLEGEEPGLQIRLSDPGRKITMRDPLVDRGHSLPLTKAIAHGIQKQNGHNIEGYRDFQGRQVMGLWTWDDNLNLGIIAEIPKQQSMGPYYQNRALIITILGITITLAFALTGFFIWSGERVNNQLKKARDNWEQLAQEEAKARRLREEKFKAMFDQTVQQMVMLDPQGKILEVNQAASLNTGMTEVQLIGMPFWEGPWFVHSETLQEEIRQACFMSQQGRFMHQEITTFHQTGQERIIDMTISPVQDDSGQVIFLLPMGHDITELKKTQYELDNNRRLLQLLFDAIPDLISAKNLQGQYIFANQAFANYVNIPVNEIQNKTDHDIFEADRAADLQQIDHKILNSLQSIQKESRYQINGDYRTFDTIRMPLMDEATAAGLVIISRDITERKEAERVIRESEERLRFTLSAVGAYYWNYDFRTLGISYDSPQFFRMLGYNDQPKELSAEGHRSLIHPEDWDQISKDIEQHLQGQSPFYQSEFRIKHANGQWVWCLSMGRISAYDENDRPSRLSGLTLDIAERKKAVEQLAWAQRVAEENADDLTESLEISESLRIEANLARKQAEEASQRAEEAAHAKAEFLATMSHEIRTPLNGVLGMVQLLKESELTPRQRDYINTIYNSGQSLLTIINDILDLSKLEASRMTLEDMSYDARHLLSGAYSLMLNRAENKGISLEYSIEEDVPAILKGDATRIQQVLLNYVSNAIKFTESGGVQIRLSLLTEDETWLKYEVIDTGIGISHEDQLKLFEQFSQVDSSVSRRYGGTGLGLAICRKIVDLMGGELGVISELGQGSNFWFKVPCICSEEKVQHVHLNTEEQTILNLPSLKILLAEDNIVNQKVTVAFLSQYNHQVIVTSNGKEAFEAYQEEAFDLILMDIHMPVMSGIEATKAIRDYENERQHQRTPIIALTASVSGLDSNNYTKVGMDGLAAKPIDLKKLMHVIAQVTDIRVESHEVPQADSAQQHSEYLDMPRLKHLEELLSHDHVINILKSYLHEISPVIRSLKDLGANKDFEALIAQAHRARGASANISLSKVADCLNHLETIAKEENYPGVMQSAQEVNQILDASLDEIKHLYPSAFDAVSQISQADHQNSNASKVEIEAALKDLIQALNSSQPVKISHSIEQLKSIGSHENFGPQIQAIIERTEAYDYKQTKSLALLCQDTLQTIP